jgi:hypothetical protein
MYLSLRLFNYIFELISLAMGITVILIGVVDVGFGLFLHHFVSGTGDGALPGPGLDLLIRV